MADPLPNRDTNLPDPGEYYDPRKDENWATVLHDALDELSINALVSSASRTNHTPRNGTLFVPSDGNGTMYIGDGDTWHPVELTNHATKAEFDSHTSNVNNPHDVTSDDVSAPSDTEFTTHTGDTSAHHSRPTAGTHLTENAGAFDVTGTASHDNTSHSTNYAAQSSLDSHTSADNPHQVTEGRYVKVDSVNDTDGTTPFDATLTISDPQAYQTYQLIGYVWGSDYSQGEGGEIPLSITVNGNTDTIYDYNELSDTGFNHVNEDTAWVETFWRRYKHPINFTISADSDPVTASDGNDSMFTSISSDGHTAARGLLNGRLADGWVDGGHPYGPLSSIELSTTDNIEGKLVLYGLDWKADL